MDLTENVINAGQKVLKRQFNIGGCQNTTLSQSLKFVGESPDKLCIQLLHTGVESLVFPSHCKHPIMLYVPIRACTVCT